MKYLFYLGHPAHFHLFKNVIAKLKEKEHKIDILIQKKDILEQLLKIYNLVYVNILSKGRKNSKINIAYSVLKKDFKIILHCLKNRPNLMIGTSAEIAHAGKILGIKTVEVNEDDFDAVPLHSKLCYPWISLILSPSSCRSGKWEYKAVKYEGYHELAYLHPKYFSPNYELVQRNLSTDRPFFILRLSGLSAHHDIGKSGITNEISENIIKMLKFHGNIYITSEKSLETQFEPYRIQINPNDIHHALYYADLYIGDSQTMAAESAVLGTPAIRFNDFVGKLGYLEELEHKYGLTYGIKTSEPDKLFDKIEEILRMPGRKQEWQKRRQKMLSEKIDVTAFMVWFIESYPESAEIMKENPDYQYNFQ